MDPIFEEMFMDLETLEIWFARNYIGVNEYHKIKNKIIENCKKKITEQKEKEPNTHAQGV